MVHLPPRGGAAISFSNIDYFYKDFEFYRDLKNFKGTYV